MPFARLILTAVAAAAGLGGAALLAPAAVDRTGVAAPAARVADAGARTRAEGYRRLRADLDRHFWDANVTPNLFDMPRLRSTEGDGGPRTGLIVDASRVPTFWQMAQYAKLMLGDWRINRSARVRAQIEAQWAYIQRVNTPAELASDGDADSTINISDDAAWKALYLAQVHEVTGDPKALAYLMEMIPATTARFADPRQRRVPYGTSPAGRPFAASPRGMLYAAHDDATATRTYGTIGSIFDAMIAQAALYVYEQSGDRDFLRYAEDTYAWTVRYLRNVKANDADAATGIYLTDLIADPSAFANGTPVAKNLFWGKPIRGLSAEYSGGTLAMAVFAADLHRVTGKPAYLVEARSIAAAFVRPDAFLRVRDGRTMFVNERDPWTDGYWYPDFVAKVLTLPGVDQNGAFRAALRGTADAILRQRTRDGYYGADWSGPELNIASGLRTWAEEAALANRGKGGGQATPQQIMTSANSAMVVQAAFALDGGAAASP